MLPLTSPGNTSPWTAVITFPSDRARPKLPQRVRRYEFDHDSAGPVAGCRDLRYCPSGRTWRDEKCQHFGANGTPKTLMVLKFPNCAFKGVETSSSWNA